MSCTKRDLDWLLGKNSSQKGDQELQQAAQECGGITIPGNGSKNMWMCPCGWFSGEHGAGLAVGLDDLKGFFPTLTIMIL